MKELPEPRPPSPARVVNVEIGEVILDGFGPLDSRTVDSRRPNAHPAAEAFRRELARELAATVRGPEAGQLAEAIAGAVFRQLATPRPRGRAR
jgi:hypothetical protein